MEKHGNLERDIILIAADEVESNAAKKRRKLWKGKKCGMVMVVALVALSVICILLILYYTVFSVEDCEEEIPIDNNVSLEVNGNN